MHKRYFGKKDPRVLEESEKGDWREEIFSRQTATFALALKILGCSHSDSKVDVRRRARTLLAELNPDRGGDVKEFLYVASAWSYVQKLWAL